MGEKRDNGEVKRSLFFQGIEIKNMDSMGMSDEKHVGIACEFAFDVEVDPFEAFHESELWSYHFLVDFEWVSLKD